MKKWHGIMGICLLLLLAAACQKKNNNTPYPQISLKDFYPDSLTSGNAEDTAFVLLDFFDGDADLSDGALVKVVNNNTHDSLTFPFPAINPELIDPSTGISGTCVVKISAIAINGRTDTVHIGKMDTTQFTVNIVDIAGHESNKVVTPNLYIRP